MVDQKNLIPIGSEIGFASTETKLIVKYRNLHKKIRHVEGCKIEFMKHFYCLKLPAEYVKEIYDNLTDSSYVLIVLEGSPSLASAIFTFEATDNNIFEEVEQESPWIRMMAYDLPPSTFTVIDAPAVKWRLYNVLALRDKELFSYRTEIFLKTPHILTYLFSTVMSLESRDNINYISVLKVVADNMRELLSTRIKRLTKNHHQLWAQLYGERICFLDGGMSRIVSLPGTEPTGIRVGIYSVIPGEVDLEKREDWSLRSFVIGDVLGDKSVIEEEIYQTDRKRLQEAARYIIEPLVALRHIESSTEKPKVLLLHGPLQYPFEAYDERSPNFIPGLSKDFLNSFDISMEKVLHLVNHIHQNSRGDLLWYSSIPIYAYIMKRLFEVETPVIGIVERGRSTTFSWQVLNLLEADKIITRSAVKSLWDKIRKYEIGDELLFGCILDEGEYIEPIPFPKNFKHRAHDQWGPVVDEFPVPSATMLKCSANSFPYRIELNSTNQIPEVDQIMSLLFHMSMLLPQYSFPVGLDIVDKYAKIPDWLSKGISERLTANILKKVLQQGDARLLMQVRNLLSLSPRDFFYRPKA